MTLDAKLEELELESYRDSQAGWLEVNMPTNFALDVRTAGIVDRGTTG